MKHGSCVVVLCASLLSACDNGHTQTALEQDTGPTPVLSEPHRSLIPTVDIAPAVGWPAQGKPVAAAGFAVNAFANGLQHPRTVYVLPNGDVLIAETNAPPKPDDGKGIKGAVMKSVMKKAGAGVPSANRITLLRDADSDGVAETRSVFLQNLNSPFGIVLVGDSLYVANTDAVVRVPYRDGETSISAAPVKVADLPAGTLNHHWTKSLAASADGKHLYVGVGSNSNVGENGMANEVDRAAVLEIDVATGARRVFASGLRNPTALAWQPHDAKLWVVVNERDELGNDLVPDYLTSVRPGAFYGFPYSYYGQHVDTRVKPQDPALVARAIPPDYALGSHVAPLGLAFYTGDALPPRFRNGAFIGLHGSWNRKPLSGYKVVFVPFNEGAPSGPLETVLDGFVNDKGDAQGRPVGVAQDRAGALLIADDVGNTIWRLTAAPATAQAQAKP
ncbi:MAG: sorbosone dehydrogenase family protein [Pseudoxanthomonas sp.]